MVGFADYEAYDGLGLAGLVGRGEVTPLDPLDAVIERVEARNGAVDLALEVGFVALQLLLFTQRRPH